MNSRARRKRAWIVGFLASGIALVFVSPIGSSPGRFPTVLLFGFSCLFFPLILGIWFWCGALWGAGASILASLLVTMAALASGDGFLLGLALEFLALGGILRVGLTRWEDRLRVARIGQERLEGQVNTLEGQGRTFSDSAAALKERLRRYQMLKAIANTFSRNLSWEELLRWVVHQVGRIFPSADLSLLYLVDPKTLTLQLTEVWRKEGHAAIPTKLGDPYDLWVMRQAQPLLVENSQEDFRFPQMDPAQLGRDVGSLLAVPLITQDRFLGVLRAESAGAHAFGPEELRLLRIVGDLASLAIENARLYHRMLELAITDDLTELASRNYFQRRLAEELSRARGLKVPLSVLVIDIDQFKGYNDTFGHAAGDKLLKVLAQRLKATCRPGEMAARFGGEEFVYLMPGTGCQEAVQRAEAIRRQAEATPVALRREMAKTTLSIGISSFPEDGWSAEALIRVADERLYRAKKMGRNRVCAA